MRISVSGKQTIDNVCQSNYVHSRKAQESRHVEEKERKGEEKGKGHIKLEVEEGEKQNNEGLTEKGEERKEDASTKEPAGATEE